ncbi:MAG: nitroreductase [Alphaproteobacteria bacterium]|nr:nitroreductase [Alphaproteobacteria bacterium]MBT7943291.1 nitroreductase [Alphaproteobacteria bacterium]
MSKHSINDLVPPAETVEQAITTRRSIRGFLDEPVDRDTVERLLTIAASAPSGTNMQPWRVYVTAGEPKDALSAAILAAHDDGPVEDDREYNYYPMSFPEPYKSRRRKVGWDLYGLLGIEKGDREKMHAQHGRNYQFFDAPVGLMFTIDRFLEIGSWLDYGMFLQNIMVAARGLGLHTCPQAAFAPHHKIIREQMNIPENEVVICGMSLGVIDPDAPENALMTEREPVEAFTTFMGL